MMVYLSHIHKDGRTCQVTPIRNFEYYWASISILQRNETLVTTHINKAKYYEMILVDLPIIDSVKNLRISELPPWLLIR